jgi:hypothetical protein
MTPEQFTAFTTALGAILADLGSILTKVLAWATSILGFITSNPIILLICAVPVIGYAFITVKGFLHN